MQDGISITLKFMGQIINRVVFILNHHLGIHNLTDITQFSLHTGQRRKPLPALGKPSYENIEIFFVKRLQIGETDSRDGSDGIFFNQEMLSIMQSGKRD